MERISETRFLSFLEKVPGIEKNINQQWSPLEGRLQKSKTGPRLKKIPETQCTHLGGEGLDRFKVEVIIQVQIVEVFPVNEKVEHVVALAAHLQPHLHPVQLRGLEEFGGFEGAKQVPGVEINRRGRVSFLVNSGAKEVWTMTLRRPTSSFGL